MENLYENIKPKHTGTTRVFKNPLLEKFSRTHISVPISIFILIGAGLLYYAYLYTTLNPYLIPALFFAGWFFFTFLEYMAHRFLFHMKPTKEWKRKLAYTAHGVHHEYPKDKTRLAMPPPASILLAAIFFIIFYLLMNTMVFGFLPGILMGYSAYLFVHYIVHAYPPPKNFFKQLWINHSMHHYKDTTMIFGVSSPLWDYIFGTYPKDQKK
jgi:4-hydroxysphinganine ceramide fatty acyl 2-hydroxylase